MATCVEHKCKSDAEYGVIRTHHKYTDLPACSDHVPEEGDTWRGAPVEKAMPIDDYVDKWSYTKLVG